MAAHTKKKAKKAPAKPRRKATKKAAAKKASTAKKTKKKALRKVPPPSARKAAKKPGTKVGKKAAQKKRAPRSARDADGDASTVISVDELTDIDSLLADDTDGKNPAAGAAEQSPPKKRGPKTPTVPRAVKPPPKIADIEMDADVLEFMEAIEQYRHKYSRPFPTWSEVFYIVRQLGYRKQS